MLWNKKYNIAGFQTEVTIVEDLPPWEELGDFFVFDQNTLPLFSKLPKNSLVLPSGEKNKQLTTVELMLEKALDFSLARDSRIVGIGGGVMTDMVALAASLYMRGTKLSLIPTTNLAMVDAAFGGKTGVDYKKFKNTLGSFYPADQLILWPNALKTLDQREYISGLAESLKAGFLADPELVRLFEGKKEAVLSRNKEVLFEMLWRSIEVKGSVVEADMREAGIRAHLNLGHTFGHAMETITNFGMWTHGEAVCWGIGQAMDLGVKLGLTSLDYAEKVKLLLRDYGFELTTPKIEVKALLDAMEKDKKKMAGELRFILQTGPQATLIHNVEREIVGEFLEGQQ